jgi:hypothetical protein
VIQHQHQNRNQPTDEAYTQAEHLLTQCAEPWVGPPAIERTRHIHWLVMPESLRAVFIGLTALPDTVYLAPQVRNNPMIVAHEMLHVAIGFPGHPGIPFSLCGLQQ